MNDLFKNNYFPFLAFLFISAIGLVFLPSTIFAKIPSQQCIGSCPTIPPSISVLPPSSFIPTPNQSQPTTVQPTSGSAPTTPQTTPCNPSAVSNAETIAVKHARRRGGVQGLIRRLLNLIRELINMIRQVIGGGNNSGGGRGGINNNQTPNTNNPTSVQPTTSGGNNPTAVLPPCPTNPPVTIQPQHSTAIPSYISPSWTVPSIVNEKLEDFPVGKTVVANGRIEIGGVPYYPNGIFYVSWGKSHSEMIATLDKVASAGLNTIHASSNDVNDFSAFLDKAEQLKIKVIAEGLNPEGIKAVKDNPAILGYNIADDAHATTTPEELASRNATVKAADPNHITYWSDYGGIDAQGPYLKAGDVPGPYDYPIDSNGKISDVDFYINQIRQAVPIFFGVPQSFNWNNGNGHRAPNAQEYRNMVYQNLMNKAMGLLDYDISASNYPDLWTEVTATAAEVKQLSSVFLNGKYTKLQTNNGVLVAYWENHGKIYIIVVNPEASSKDATFSVPGNGSAQPMFSGRPTGMTFTGGNLSGAIGALDVHVYIIN